MRVRSTRQRRRRKRRKRRRWRRRVLNYNTNTHKIREKGEIAV
jgi:hypothetical protein